MNVEIPRVYNEVVPSRLNEFHVDPQLTVQTNILNLRLIFLHQALSNLVKQRNLRLLEGHDLHQQFHCFLSVVLTLDVPMLSQFIMVHEEGIIAAY